MKDISELISLSWKEFKENWKMFLLMIFLLSFVPSIILGFVSLNFERDVISGIGSSDINITDADGFMVLTEIWGIINGSVYFIPMILGGVLIILLYFLLSASMINYILLKKKPNFSGAIKGGSSVFLRFLLYNLVVLILMIPLMLLFFVPALIFMVYWVFSSFVLIGEKKGIIESLKKSFNLVRGRWWMTFGYILLMIVFMVLFSVVIGMINSLLIEIVSGSASMNPVEFGGIVLENYSYPVSVIIMLINSLISLLSNVFIIPLSIIYLKNIYIEYKGFKSKK